MLRVRFIKEKSLAILMKPELQYHTFDAVVDKK
jgi:hypothetical protein